MKMIAAGCANDCTTKCQVLVEMNLNIHNQRCRPEAGEEGEQNRLRPVLGSLARVAPPFGILDGDKGCCGVNIEAIHHRQD
jgi:hypothetical protein